MEIYCSRASKYKLKQRLIFIKTINDSNKPSPWKNGRIIRILSLKIWSLRFLPPLRFEPFLLKTLILPISLITIFFRQQFLRLTPYLLPLFLSFSPFFPPWIFARRWGFKCEGGCQSKDTYLGTVRRRFRFIDGPSPRPLSLNPKPWNSLKNRGYFWPTSPWVQIGSTFRLRRLWHFVGGWWHEDYGGHGKN